MTVTMVGRVAGPVAIRRSHSKPKKGRGVAAQAAKMPRRDAEREFNIRDAASPIGTNHPPPRSAAAEFPDAELPLIRR